MTLHHDPILQQPDRLILDPDLLRKHLAHQRFIAVLLHPALVPVAVTRPERVHADPPLAVAFRRGARGVQAAAAAVVQVVHVVGREGGFVVGLEARQRGPVAALLPRSQGAAVAGVDDDAEALVGGDHDVEADEEEREGEEAPPAALARQDEEDGEDQPREDVQVAVPFDEQHARSVAVADAPADEVGVRLPPQGGFDHVFDEGEGAGVGGVLEGVQHRSAVPV